jgi:hypothetical protein
MPIDIDEVLNVFSGNERRLDFSLYAFFEFIVLKSKTFILLKCIRK